MKECVQARSHPLCPLKSRYVALQLLMIGSPDVIPDEMPGTVFDSSAS